MPEENLQPANKRSDPAVSAESGHRSILQTINRPPADGLPNAMQSAVPQPIPQWPNTPPNTPYSSGCSDCQPGDSYECVEMNFGDLNECEVQCPLPQTCPPMPACPMPITGTSEFADSDIPMQPLPAAPEHPSALDNNLIPTRPSASTSPIEPDPAGFRDDDPSQWVPQLNTPDLDHQGAKSSLEDSLCNPLQENTQPLESSANADDQREQFRDYIFENASFKTPRHQRTASDPDQDPQRNGIVIHPPIVQPYNKNQHTFLVQNLGEFPAKDLMIEISVPAAARILATLPANSVHSTQTAAFRFDEIQAGESVPIHVTAVSDNPSAIEFKADVVSRSVYSFSVHGQEQAGVLKNVSYSRSPISAGSDVQQIPDGDGYNGPVLVRNPFFQSRTRDHQAGVPEDRR